MVAKLAKGMEIFHNLFKETFNYAEDKEWHTILALGDGFNIMIINSHLLDEVNDEVWNTSQSDGLMRSVFSFLRLLITC